MKKLWQTFWAWYGRHHDLNLIITAGLFALQLVHLYWLTVHVVFLRLFGVSFFNITGFWQYLIIIVDYTEIPALIATSLYYAYELRRGFSWKSVWFLIALNSQWMHLFWITDEVVVQQFSGVAPIALPVWLAWIAICIDYLELPVMYDTLKRTYRIGLGALKGVAKAN